MARRNMKPGFHRDAKAIGRIAKNDKGLKAFIHDTAEQGAARAGGHVEDYVTDRSVSAVVVGAEDAGSRDVGREEWAVVAAGPIGSAE